LIQKSMLALAICLAVSAPEVFAASAYEDASSVAADMAAAAPVQNVQNTQKVQAVSQSKPQKQKKLKESDIIKQVEAATPRPEASAMAAKDYLLRAGDQLNIVVTQQQDLGNSSANQTPFTVRPDGNVSFPLVGEIHAEGMTVSEFTNVLTYGLSRYIVDPDVAVNITKLGRTRVYVFGEVKKPGAVELEKSHTVIDAIGAAEGFTRDTAKKKIYLIHQDEPQSLIKVNLNNMLRTGDMSENYVMREGDLLYMTRNNRIDFARDIAPILSSLYLITETKDNLDNN
jgi:polysaccharide biosynthesis/export protein